MRTSLVVLGMHHSGGGAVAAALAHCGARLAGREELRAACDALLQGTGANWPEMAGASGPWVVEDPRLCLLLSALRQRIPDPVCLLVVRNPLDVARALQAERGVGMAEGLALWEAYNASALHASEGLARVQVSWEEMAAHPRECLEELLQALGRLGVQGLELPEARMLEALIAPAPDCAGEVARRHAAEDVAVGLTAAQKFLWQRLSSGGLDAEADRNETEREGLARALNARAAQVADLKSKAKAQASEIEILNQRVAWLDAQAVEIQASRSWRITAPLRALATTTRKTRTALARTAGSGGQAPVQRRSGARAPAALEGEETFVLYRIIGNDLHPRHKRGQAIENLQFILEHEPALEGCEKRFVLNRILDAAQEREIAGLLERAGFEYVRIPFDPGEYARVGFDTDVLPDPGFLSGERFDALDDAGRGRLLAALYRHKNNYVMNNNGARNAALQDGRGRAKWILPWDGNCFLTGEAWEAIRRDVAKAPRNRYFTVPMARMPSNAPLVDGGEIPRAVEEPQIMFRADAEERFNPAFCYGRRPKVELLWRLGVRGPWDAYPDDSWDQPRPLLSPEAAAVGKAGWVARLSSGMATLEADSHQAPLHRGLARAGAIQATLQHLDAQLAGADSEHPVSIRPRVLQREIELQGAAPLKDIVRTLLRTADDALERPCNRADLQRAFDDSLALALAWSFTGRGQYAKRGSDILERLFVDPGTRMAPRSSRNEDTGADPAGMHSMYYYLDAVLIFDRAGSVGESAKAGFRAWLGDWLEWLSTSLEGVSARRAGDHRGTCHDLQVASIASFLDDQAQVYGTLMRAQARIAAQFAPDGRQPGEFDGPATLHRRCFSFQSWINLAELASRWGVDLWGYRAPDGSGLAQGARRLLSEPPHGQANAFDVERLHPVRFAASEFVDGLPQNGGAESTPYAIKPLFHPGDGIRPFWNLASYGTPARR